MNFPVELIGSDQEKAMIDETLELFASSPVIMVDGLANSVYFNSPAENLFGERGESLVNRSIFSLLGFDSFAGMPQSLVDGLSGDGGAWRGFVSHPTDRNMICFAEASAIVHEIFRWGIIRFDDTKIMPRPKPKTESSS